MWRTRFTWSGFSGAPGTSTLYGDVSTGTSQVFANDAFTLLNNLFKPTGTGVNLPSGVRVAQDPFLDEIDESTGHQVGRLAVTPGADIVGINTSNWSAPSGACITWSTNTFILGRRLKGRLFLVPLSAACFANDGTLDSAFLSSVVASITTYINGQSVPVVWHRPTLPNSSDGLMSPVITGQMKDKVSVLRSRRD
jgi:hypothetical protein